ncbi:hypothetical protein FACS1894137_17450 [Spirochaetia bacterium]|nr:hypothetical protein FACS1894137_17450 [Spirochaetia bacterium]
MGTILEQLLSVQTIVALCTGIGVIFTIYQNHRIKTNDLQHLEKYTVAIGNAAHAILLHMNMKDEAQKLHQSMADAFIDKK